MCSEERRQSNELSAPVPPSGMRSAASTRLVPPVGVDQLIPHFLPALPGAKVMVVDAVRLVDCLHRLDRPPIRPAQCSRGAADCGRLELACWPRLAQGQPGSRCCACRLWPAAAVAGRAPCACAHPSDLKPSCSPRRSNTKSASMGRQRRGSSAPPAGQAGQALSGPGLSAGLCMCSCVFL